MVCEWGMSAMGMRAFRKAGNGFEGDKTHAMSEATARRVDDEIEKILKGGYDRALDLLNRNRLAVKNIAEALLDVEALDADELKALLGRAGARP
jgi:cell division protease FtsH